MPIIDVNRALLAGTFVFSSAFFLWLPVCDGQLSRNTDMQH